MLLHYKLSQIIKTAKKKNVKKPSGTVVLSDSQQKCSGKKAHFILKIFLLIFPWRDWNPFAYTMNQNHLPLAKRYYSAPAGLEQIPWVSLLCPQTKQFVQLLIANRQGRNLCRPLCSEEGCPCNSFSPTPSFPTRYEGHSRTWCLHRWEVHRVGISCMGTLSINKSTLQLF